MQPIWQDMSVAHYATFEGLLGDKTVVASGLHWAQVRPFFYRPLMVSQEHSPGSVTAPRPAFVGGFQHAVHSGEPANSTLNLLMFTDAKSYSLDTLDYNRKRQVKKAAKELSIRPITVPSEFKTQAYPIYLSFAERTRYSYGSQRRQQPRFDQWADALFRLPSVAVLGGFRNGALGGVSLSFLIENTLFYATFFCDTPSVRLHLSDLMLHFVREAAASQGVSQIFSGMYKGGNSLDDFYLLRGCSVLSKPALFHVNPLTKMLLARWMPNRFSQLQGRFEPNSGKSAKLNLNGA
jgi:hypothetical protein